MEFFNGSIEQAVTLSKSKNAVFVVFVEGPSTDEKSKLRELIDDTQIRSKLQSDDFVVIKVTSDSQAYMQFAAIYQVVPVPSLFFIGKSGQPLEIATDTLKTIDELEEKVIRVLKLSGKSTPQAGGAGTSSSSSSAFIAAEQVAAAAVAAPVAAEVPAKEAPKKEEIEPAVAAKADVEAEAPKTEKAAEPEVAAAPNSEPEKAAAEPEKVADDVDMKEAATEQTPTVAAPAPAVADIPKPKETQAATATKVVKPTPAQPTVAASAAATAAEQRSAGVSPVQSQEAIKRPPVVDLKELERLKKEQELKELKDSLKRDRLLEQQARERIRAQIAGDRAERAQRKEDTESNASTAANRGTSPTSTSGGVAQQKSKSFNISDPDNTCLQFRLPSGDHHTHIFQASQLLSDVRAFVKMDLLSGSGIRDFYLATSYPRREFGAEDDENTLLQLGLVPNAVILVIAKESKISPANIVARSGGILNLLSSLMTMIFTPFFSVFDYMRSYFRKRPAPDAPQEEPNDAAKRRNLDNLNMGPSTSRAAALGDLSRFNVAGGGHASGTGSAGGGGQSTGNGNVDGGTKPYRRFGGSNIHRLNDSRKDSDDENATWNGNSTQQQ